MCRNNYDYEIKLCIIDIVISFEVVREREYVDSCNIQDGFEYVLDECGNVVKDLLGNDIIVFCEVIIEVWVLEILQ